MVTHAHTHAHGHTYKRAHTHMHAHICVPVHAGVKVNNAEALDSMGLDRSRLARLSVESYLQQILRYGFFHADPHP